MAFWHQTWAKPRKKRCSGVNPSFVAAYFGIHLHVFVQRCQGDAQPAIVSRVFTQRQPAVEMNIIHRDKRAVFIGNAGCALVKFVAVRLCPPVFKVAFRIELAALVVKAMRKFMANHYADAAKIHGIIRIFIEERRLQNAGREINVIVWRAVIGVHGWRRHAPLFLVQRLANLIEIALDFKRARSLDIANKIAAHDLHRTVVAPGVRVADFVGDGMQLY